MPHFFVDDAFSDSKEVLAIPARHRLAAVGLWSLCGSWSAAKLTDGFVPNDVVKRLGGRPALVDALVDLAKLWVREPGGIRFTNWSKWQRTREQVEAYRAAQAEKKRAQREKLASNSQSTDTCQVNASLINSRNASPEESPGDMTESSLVEEVSGQNSQSTRESCPQGTPQTPIPTPKPIYRDNSFGDQATDTYAPGISATPGADLVRQVVPKGHPSATLTSLRIQASELLHQGAEADVVRAALQLWCDKPNVGIGRTILSSLYSEAIKSRAAPRPGAQNSNGLNAGESKVAGWAALGQTTTHGDLKAINE